MSTFVLILQNVIEEFEQKEGVAIVALLKKEKLWTRQQTEESQYFRTRHCRKTLQIGRNVGHNRQNTLPQRFQLFMSIRYEFREYLQRVIES
jgi:hypothetical protein